MLRNAAKSPLLPAVFALAGVIAMLLLSDRETAARLHPIPIAVLWLCLAFFVLDMCFAVTRAVRANELRAYMHSGTAMTDALAVLPVPIALLAGVAPATAWLLASLWLFKLSPVSPGVTRLGRVIVMEARPLASVLVIFLGILIFAAVSLHLLERHQQPDVFGSVGATLWWAVATLTTVGYGDAVPVTAAGRMVAGIVMICGVGVFGLLTGILATGFVDESRRESFVENWNLVKNVPFFRALEPAAIIEIARMLRQWQVSEGTVVIKQGREGDCMYFVASGEVEIDIHPPVRLGPGSFFGELALLGSGVRNATVTTTLPSTLLVLEAADFRTFTAHHPALAASIEAEATRRSAARSGAPAL